MGCTAYLKEPICLIDLGCTALDMYFLAKGSGGAGARAGRMLRMIRLLRFVRVMRAVEAVHRLLWGLSEAQKRQINLHAQRAQMQ